MIVLLKKLRILLLYKLIIISFFLVLFYVFLRVKFDVVKEYDSITLNGVVSSIKVSDSYCSLEVKSKKNFIIYVNCDDSYSLGEVLSVTGSLKVPNDNSFFNLFNYRKYLKSKKINYIMVPSEINHVAFSKDFRYILKNRLIDYINSFRSKNYLKTFILGDSSDIDDNVIKSYQLNGVSHLFAISGMHLSLFAFILFFVFRKFKLSDNVINIIVILFFLLFCFFTSYSPSILRAFFMYVFLFFNRLFDLKIKNIYILLFVVILLLLYNPFYIYSVGFLFSCVVSFFLIFFSDIILSYKNYFFKVFITSLISQLSSLPIQINNFFQINVFSCFFNVIFVPFISFIIFPFSLLTLFFKPLDNLFFYLLTFFEFLSLNLSKFGFFIVLSHISWYVIICYYFLILFFIKGLRYRKFCYFVPLLIVIFIHSNVGKFSFSSSFFMLDVGQGDSIFFKSNDKSILIDTGGVRNKDIVVSKTIPFFKSIGVNKLDYLIITHGDFDHMGEAINLVKNFKVEKVIFNCGPYNNLEKELIKVLDKKHIKYYSCIKELNIDNDKLYFLQTKEYDNENDNSNVIYTELNGYKFMFMGDASVITEKEIMSKYNLPEIDVLKVGHHGSKTSSDKNFINEINPNYSIISVGKNNRYGHPNKEVLDNLENSKIYRTDQDGSIMFEIKNNKLKIETCSP